MERKVYEVLASAVQARQNCIVSGNTEWRDRHETTIVNVVKTHLPSGSGFDNGTTLDVDASTPNKLVFVTAFHHMNDRGMYDGWTDHIVTITPAFVGGFDMKVSGKNRRDIKEYIAESFHHSLVTLTEIGA